MTEPNALMPDDRDPTEPQARQDMEQQQDMAEREEKLREILNVLWHGAGYEDTRWDTDDIDFIATCCGVADYRKSKL